MKDMGTQCDIRTKNKCTEFCVKCGQREKKLATSIFKNILGVPSTLETKTYFLYFTPVKSSQYFLHIFESDESSPI